MIAGGVAERAGVLAGDQVLAIGGVAVNRWDEVVAAIGANPAREVMLEIKRGDTTLEIQVTPAAVIENSGRIGRIGVAVKVDQAAMRRYMVEVRYPPWASLGKALERTWDTSVFSLRMLGQNDRRRGVAEEPERPDHDRRLRRPVRADRLDFISGFSRPDQHQSGRAQFIAHTLIGWRPFDVLYA